MQKINEKMIQKYLPVTALVISIVALMATFVFRAVWLVVILALVGLAGGIYALVKKWGPLNWASVVISIVALFLVLIARVAGGDSISLIFRDGQVGETASDVPTKPVGVKTSALKLTHYELVPPAEASSAATVVGTVKNSGRETLAMPVITFTAYDAQGQEVPGGCLAIKTTSIEPGEVWEFTADCSLNATPVRVELAEIDHTVQVPEEE